MVLVALVMAVVQCTQKFKGELLFLVNRKIVVKETTSE